MKLAILSMETFLDLLADMPDIEAIDEVDSRLQRILDDRRELGDATGQHEFRQALNLEEDQLRLHRNKLVFRVEQRKWSKAVKAVYGQEGLDACLEWMRTTPDAEVKSIALRKSNVKCGRQ